MQKSLQVSDERIESKPEGTALALTRLASKQYVHFRRTQGPKRRVSRCRKGTERNDLG